MGKLDDQAVNASGERFPGGRVPGVLSSPPDVPENNQYDTKKPMRSPMDPGEPPGRVAPSPAEFRDDLPVIKLPGDRQPVDARARVLVTKPGDPPVARYEFQGLPIVVENPAGSVRSWVDEHGAETGRTKMLYDYGYIAGYSGLDGDEVDCYVGPRSDSDQVFVVHQMKRPDYDGVDEDKVLLGFGSLAEAKAAYLAHYSDPRGYGAVTPLSMAQFKTSLARLKDGGPQMIRRRSWRALAAPEGRDDASSASLVSSGGAVAPDVGAFRPPPSVTGKRPRGAARLRTPQIRRPYLRWPITVDGKPKLSKFMPPVRHPTHDPLPEQMLPAPKDPGENPYREPGLH